MGNKEENGVSSNIELTKKKGGRSLSLQKYRSDIGVMSKKITKFAMGLCGDNLLSVKMALMGAVREVEEKIRGNKE